MNDKNIYVSFPDTGGDLPEKDLSNKDLSNKDLPNKDLPEAQIPRADLLKTYLREMIIYTILVIGYFLLAANLLSSPLKTWFDHHRNLYAILALLLIIGQGIILEMLTTVLLTFIKTKVPQWREYGFSHLRLAYQSPLSEPGRARYRDPGRILRCWR
ncbi:MAG: hypothetical protein HY326_03900 [Chloroflexi bacterium]|nr:hypothetical protein [Chloroflexota bacterium]